MLSSTNSNLSLYQLSKAHSLASSLAKVFLPAASSVKEKEEKAEKEQEKEKKEKNG